MVAGTLMDKRLAQGVQGLGPREPSHFVPARVALSSWKASKSRIRYYLLFLRAFLSFVRRFLTPR